MNNLGDRNQAGLPLPRAVDTGRGVPRVSAASLFAGARELIIEHGGEEYRLRVTSKGKLILTK
jgi:hemin uptake protein HemP